MTDVTLNKKRFIETLAEQGTVSCAAKAAGVSRMTAYRWREDDREFSAAWDEAMETAVDAVESVLYQKAKSGETVPLIFYLKAHRPMYRDRLTINVPQLQNEAEERIAQLKRRLPSSSTAELIKARSCPDIDVPGLQGQQTLDLTPDYARFDMVRNVVSPATSDAHMSSDSSN